MKKCSDIVPDKRTCLPWWKRVLDVSLVILALPVLIPVASAIAALIGLVSKGPILFKQERIGLGGKKFLCFKFRTMHVGAESVSHQGHLRNLINSDAPMTKMDSHGDKRIIPFGVFLRATGLDELPQLINVLRGEMSIVGPRPCLPYEFEQYLPWQRERCAAAPGLTGLWQVSGKNKTTFTQMIRLDIEYSQRCNPMLDIEIIVRTVPTLLLQVLDTSKKKAEKAVGFATDCSQVAKKTITVQTETILSARIVNH